MDWIRDNWNNSLTIILSLLIFLNKFIKEDWQLVDTYLQTHSSMTIIIGSLITAAATFSAVYLTSKADRDNRIYEKYTNMLRENYNLIKKCKPTIYNWIEVKSKSKDNLKKISINIIQLDTDLLNSLQKALNEILTYKTSRKTLKIIIDKITPNIQILLEYLEALQKYIELFKFNYQNKEIELKPESNNFSKVIKGDNVITRIYSPNDEMRHYYFNLEEFFKWSKNNQYNFINELKTDENKTKIITIESLYTDLESLINLIEESFD